MAAHAKLSPSSAHRWMRCPGSVVLEAGLPDTGSSHAAWGTDAHELSAICLAEQTAPDAYRGRIMGLGNEVDQDMLDCVQEYVDRVRDYALVGELMVEQRMPIGHITGEPEAYGTSDAVVLCTDDEELQVHDLKAGRGVKVDADENEQLQIYALAALREFDMLAEWKTIRMVIHQPRLGHVSEWDQSREDLEAFGKKVRQAAHLVEAAEFNVKGNAPDFAEKYLMPGDKQCRFCKAKATCPALRGHVLTTVADDFVDTTEPLAPQLADAAGLLGENDAAVLANCLGAVDTIEAWCKAVRAEVERRLLAGLPVPGFKLVQGRKGSRAWSDEATAEQTLKAMRVKHDQMYDYKVISPTSAEKLAKAEVIGPRQWPKLAELIVQSEGKPSVAPETDKRPALVVKPTADEFADETAGDLA